MVIQLPSNYQRYWTISQSAAPKSVNLRVYIPANAPVGIWNMELTLKNKFGIVQQKLRIPNKIIILFNPMSSGTMSDKLKLKEYVFNEVGLISQMTVAKVWFYNQTQKLYYSFAFSVGTSVYTKVVGNNSLEDIVHLYKPREGTKEERQSYNAAARVKGITPASTRFGRSRRDTVAIEIIAVKKAAIGSKVTILIKVKSLSLKTQTVTLGIKITSVYYDGQDSKTLVERQFSGLKLAAHSTKRLQVILDQNDYVDKLEAFNTNRIEAVVMTEDGHFAHAVQKLSFTVPKLHITCPKVVGVNEEFILKAEFKNPFNKTLKNCKFTYEGSRIEKNEVNLNDVTVGERVAIELRIKARYPRNETIIVTFVSSSLKDVEGTANVQIIGEKPKQPVISFPPRPPTDKGVNSVKENQSFDSKV
ncbi:hemocyte protein-glutamine gamma-glutamyltransferase-like protein [Leptotrombidium deliense]|uniref:Hemocyte protein-glutamine gamma-glutamyltransferase-like protein n=1 Tax=Leptotrombidium deliense TaxID=299467 RepID=A0A443SSI0_9ACAR|nr:hemocyte protein-glutamine gamma-glutamyltransferase-like protein [Leptotrombidium deliense]